MQNATGDKLTLASQKEIKNYRVEWSKDLGGQVDQ